MSKHDFEVGDRVWWMGGVDFGRRLGRYHGRITKLGLGVVRTIDPRTRQPVRVRAAQVELDPGQHDMTDRLARWWSDDPIALDLLNHELRQPGATVVDHDSGDENP